MCGIFCDCTQDKTSLNANSQVASDSEPIKPKPVVKRQWRVGCPDIDAEMSSTLLRILQGQKLLWNPTSKTTRGLHNGRSYRRSRYLGVSRNRTRFLALINVNNKKQYIGTYCDEAAMVYDFYAIGLKGSQAHVNFTYDSDLLAILIQDFY